MYDQETDRTDTRHQREADALCDPDGKHDIVHLGTGYGVSFLLGLWAKEVDNAEIFKMISPAFLLL